MKQILQTLSIALLLPIASIAQNSVTITGTVTNDNGLVPNAVVSLLTPSSPAMPGETVATVLTDEFGAYVIQEDLEQNYGALELYSDSCNFVMYLDSMWYPFQENIDLDCTTGSGGGEDCEAMFGQVPDSSAIGGSEGFVYFYNLSQGTDLSYLWDFGDGTESTDQYPMHTYGDSEIEYTVCLTISGEDCDDTFCMQVSADMDGPGLTGDNSNEEVDGETEETEFTFVVLEEGTTLGTNKLEAIDFNIYPNPSNGNIKLDIDLPSNENGVVNVMDITGKVVFQQGNVFNKSTNLDLSILPDGIYVVHFAGKKSFAARKIVLQR